MKNKIIILGLNLINLSILSNCATPSNSSISNSNQSTINSNNVNIQLSIKDSWKKAFTSIFESELILKNGEAVSNQSNSFKTKALLDLNSNLSANIDNLTNLSISTDLSADVLANLGVTNFTVKTSNVVTTNNSDGSTSKTILIDFKNKTSGRTKNDKVVKTFSSNGSVKLEQFLSIKIDNFNKNVERKSETINNQTIIKTSSSESISGGISINIKEDRNTSYNNQMAGSGSINIKEVSGESTDFSFSSQINNEGKLVVNIKDSIKNVEINLVEKTNSSVNATIVSNSTIQTTELNSELHSESYINSSVK